MFAQEAPLTSTAKYTRIKASAEPGGSPHGEQCQSRGHEMGCKLAQSGSWSWSEEGEAFGGNLLFHKISCSRELGRLWCGLRAWSHFIIWTSSGRVTSSPMPSGASCSQNALTAPPDTLSPDEGWPLTSRFNLSTQKGVVRNTMSDSSSRYKALCLRSHSVWSRSFYYSARIYFYFIFSLPVSGASAVLKAKEPLVSCSLACAPKWRQTVTDTALPVISPEGFLGLLYDGHADLTGSDTERDVNTTDPLKIQRGAQTTRSRDEGARYVSEGVRLHKSCFAPWKSG